jgi:hypothetical protein
MNESWETSSCRVTYCPRFPMKVFCKNETKNIARSSRLQGRNDNHYAVKFERIAMHGVLLQQGNYLLRYTQQLSANC